MERSLKGAVNSDLEHMKKVLPLLEGLNTSDPEILAKIESLKKQVNLLETSAGTRMDMEAEVTIAEEAERVDEAREARKEREIDIKTERVIHGENRMVEEEAVRLEDEAISKAKALKLKSTPLRRKYAKEARIRAARMAAEAERLAKEAEEEAERIKEEEEDDEDDEDGEEDDEEDSEEEEEEEAADEGADFLTRVRTYASADVAEVAGLKERLTNLVETKNGGILLWYKNLDDMTVDIVGKKKSFNDVRVKHFRNNILAKIGDENVWKLHDESQSNYNLMSIMKIITGVAVCVKAGEPVLNTRDSELNLKKMMAKHIIDGKLASKWTDMLKEYIDDPSKVRALGDPPPA